jgi:hypothetical protein
MCIQTTATEKDYSPHRNRGITTVDSGLFFDDSSMYSLEQGLGVSALGDLLSIKLKKCHKKLFQFSPSVVLNSRNSIFKIGSRVQCLMNADITVLIPETHHGL